MKAGGFTSQIDDFYEGKVLLLTGCTGFLGKVLLERLLWENLGRRPLRLLARGEPNARVEELAASPIFTRLRKRHATAADDDFRTWLASQVQCFPCDLEAERLGMDPELQRAALGGVHIVIHSAARVSWDERLDAALRANTLGTRRLFVACAEEADAQNPPTFVHVSSTFVHGMSPAPHAEKPLSHCSIRSLLQGKVATHEPAPAFDIEKLIAEALKEGEKADASFNAMAAHGNFRSDASARLPTGASEAELCALEKRIAERRARTQMSEYGIKLARQHGWWDPYTLSKALAEMCLETESRARGMPLVVVRPSGISSCALEPMPGWIDCYLLNEPIIVATGRGQLTAFPGREDSVLDMVPADFVVNLMLAAATQTAVPVAQPLVFQCASGDINPVHQGDLARWWYDYFCRHPFRTADGKPVAPVQPKLIPTLDAFLARMRWRAEMPLSAAAAMATVLPSGASWAKKLRGQIGKMRGAVDNAMRLATLYSVYTIERFEFKAEKGRTLLKSLSEEDRRRFDPAGCQDIDWRAYFDELHIPGMRKFVLKEEGVEPLNVVDTKALSRLQPPVSRI